MRYIHISYHIPAMINTYIDIDCLFEVIMAAVCLDTFEARANEARGRGGGGGGFQTFVGM